MASAVVIGRYLRHRIYGEPPFPPQEIAFVADGQDAENGAIEEMLEGNNEPKEKKKVRERSRKG